MGKIIQAVHLYDNAVGQFFNKLPRSLYRAMIVVSFFGQPVFTLGIIIFVGLYAWDIGSHRMLIASLLALLGISISSLIKFITERSRPKSRYVDNMWFDTYSFPSGHASGSTIAYGLLLVVFAANLDPSHAAAAIVACIVGRFLIGISRIYLEAHYPSDVTAGWIIGGATLVACYAALSVNI